MSPELVRVVVPTCDALTGVYPPPSWASVVAPVPVLP